MPAPRAASRTAPAAAPVPPCLQEHPARSGTAGRQPRHGTAHQLPARQPVGCSTSHPLPAALPVGYRTSHRLPARQPVGCNTPYPLSAALPHRLRYVTPTSGTAAYRLRYATSAFGEPCRRGGSAPLGKPYWLRALPLHGRTRFGTERGGVRFIDYTGSSEQPRNGRGGKKRCQRGSYSRRWRSWKLNRLLAVSDQAAWVAPSISEARLFVLSRAWFAPPMTAWHSGHVLLSIAPPQSPIT